MHTHLGGNLGGRIFLEGGGVDEIWQIFLEGVDYLGVFQVPKIMKNDNFWLIFLYIEEATS